MAKFLVEKSGLFAQLLLNTLSHPSYIREWRSECWKKKLAAMRLLPSKDQSIALKHNCGGQYCATGGSNVYATVSTNTNYAGTSKTTNFLSFKQG
jgi:hypothetical protein